MRTSCIVALFGFVACAVGAPSADRRPGARGDADLGPMGDEGGVRPDGGATGATTAPSLRGEVEVQSDRYAVAGQEVGSAFASVRFFDPASDGCARQVDGACTI